MAYRPAQIYTGSGWDDIGDPRVGTLSSDVTALQSDVTALQSGKVDYATPVNAQNGSGGTAYTFVLADGTRLTSATNAAAKTFLIPPQTSVAWPNNSIIRVVNYGAGALTIAGGSGVTVTNTATTIGQYEAAAAIRTGSNAWTLVPFSGGVSNADFSNAATGTYSSGGFNYKYVTFNSSSTLTVTKSGIADILVCAGGGGSGSTSGGAGGGGGLITETIFLQSGSFSVVIGGGGSGGISTNAGNPGGSSYIGPFFALYGGRGGGNSTFDTSGGSGGGFNFSNYGSGQSIPRQGHNGVFGGGGGGAGSAGSGGTGGNGRSSSITNTAIVYARGGSWNNGRVSTANRGEGADASGRAGSSGVAIVRVRV